MKSAFEVAPVINGSGLVIFSWQNKSGNYLATTGTNKAVNIFDRHGEHKSNVLISLPGLCTSLAWDKDGGMLTVANNKNGILHFWNSHNSEVIKFDTGMKEYPSLCLWSKVGHVLAVGTSKGNVLLYNHHTKRKIPILGKHTKIITCGQWSSQNLLALGSSDRSVTISNAEGDTLRQTSLRAEPYVLQFSQMKLDKQNTEETTVSMVVGHKTLYLYDMDNVDNPIELAFQNRYGNIVTYNWYGDGYIMIGFSNGYFVVISTHRDEIGQELFQSHNHKNFLSDVAISTALNQAASCGDNSIKIHDLSELKEVYTIVNVEEEKGTLQNLGWTDDGQLLTVSTLTGGIYTYIAQLPMLGDACGLRLAYLTSLLEITVVNNVEKEQPLKMQVSVEPHVISLGPSHIAIGMNDRVWIHDINEQGAVSEKSYSGSVAGINLNASLVAVLFDAQILLHRIDPADVDYTDNSATGLARNDQEGKIFPEEGTDDVITCMSLTAEILFYGTEGGKVVMFVLEDWQFVNEFRHALGIVKVFPDIGGSKMIIIDDKSDAFVYKPVLDQVMEIKEFPPGVKSVLWENTPDEKHIFICHDANYAYTYTYFSNTIDGPVIAKVGITKLPFGHLPLMLNNGEMSCQTLTGKLSTVRLDTHVFSDGQGFNEEELKLSLKKCIALKRFKDAWAFAKVLDAGNSWDELAKSALYHMEIGVAIRTYQHVRNVGMVYALNKIKDVDDFHLLVGHIWLLMGSYDQAQKHFLASSNPVEALEMRRDLLNWNQALNLAKTLAPEQVPYISKAYAYHLEFVGDYTNALIYYECGETSKDTKHDAACTEGVARMAIRTGDIRRGILLTHSANSKTLYKDCADILDSLKLYAEAGALYEKCQCWDRAATAFVKLKNWDQVQKLLKYITSGKIHGQYAKAREADGKFVEAVKAYETARDYESAIRIYLDCLKKPDDAVRIVNEYHSLQGAKMVARFFEKINDISSALNFLVLSNCQAEAYAMAKSHGCMEQYAMIIGDKASCQDYSNIATYFDSKRDYFMAGKFYFSAKMYSKALQRLIQCPVMAEGENIEMAIEVIGAADDESLAQNFRDYLMGEIDGTSKDAKFLFKFYLALHKYREAAKTAVLISKEEQNEGNYRNAHDVLFNMRSELVRNAIDLPLEMTQSLMLLHSYLLVKLHVRLGNHAIAARLLIRVANSISRFPSHIVPILTSTVIECQRSGLHGSAFTFASMLLRPEYRQSIDTKYKKKIEQIVRKPDKSEVDEIQEPCPRCRYLIPQTKLDCPQCKTSLPYCIVTGRHMTNTDCTQCPVCMFPASYSEFSSFLKASTDSQCPMCSNTIQSIDLKQTKFHI